jgi:dTMP kinase
MSKCKKGLWIAVDGCEGAGKTTLVERLKKRFPNVVYVPEFSRSETGRFLSQSVLDKPYEVVNSPMASALLFLSDYFYLVDTLIAPAVQAGKTVVSDRGFLSKIAVQAVVLEQLYSKQAVEEMLSSVFSLSLKPDFSIVLDTPLAEVEKRIVCRCGACDAVRLQTIERTKEKMRDCACQWGLPCCFYVGDEAETIAVEKLKGR